MDIAKEFDDYMAYLMQGLGHADRHSGLTGYCTGLMLPLSRNSVEPIAARVDPLHASAKHQSLHHFVAKAQWSDQELLRRIAQWRMTVLGLTPKAAPILRVLQCVAASGVVCVVSSTSLATSN